MIEALSELPPQLLIDLVKGIYRLSKSSNETSNPGSSYLDKIAKFGDTFKLGKGYSD